MSRVFAILDAIPQVRIGIEMVAKVTSDLLLHLLVSTAVTVVTTAAICSSFAPTMSAASAMLIYAACAPWSASRPLS
jgi:hypothetical protein